MIDRIEFFYLVEFIIVQNILAGMKQAQVRPWGCMYDHTLYW